MVLRPYRGTDVYFTILQKYLTKNVFVITVKKEIVEQIEQ